MLLLCSLLGCGERQAAAHLRLLHEATVDESTFAWRSFPGHTELVDDSTAALIVNRKLCTYNINSGKLQQQFDGLKMNWDSILRTTYAKAYTGRLIFLPTSDTGAVTGMSRMAGSHVTAFCYRDGIYWVYFQALSRYVRIDSSEARQLLLNDTVHHPGLSTTALAHARINEFELRPFMLRLDAQFHLESVLPLYENRFPAGENGQYGAYLEKGFTVRDNRIYCCITDAAILPEDTIYFKDSDRVDFIGTLLYEGDSIRFGKILLDSRNKHMPLHTLSWANYFDLDYAYTGGQDSLAANIGVGWWDIQTGTKSKFDPGENLSSTLMMDGAADGQRLFYTALPADSLRQKNRRCHLRVYDTNTGRRSFDTVLGGNAHFGFRDHKLVYVDRDATHYYFRTYSLEP